MPSPTSWTRKTDAARESQSIAPRQAPTRPARPRPSLGVAAGTSTKGPEELRLHGKERPRASYAPAQGRMHTRCIDADVVRLALRSRSPALRTNTETGFRELPRKSCEIPERGPHLLCGAEQAILRSFFRGTKCLANRTETH